MRLIEERPRSVDAFPAMGEEPSPDLICVGGGKGGVGKTCFAVNIAVAIANRGWRVVLVDADLSCSNVETVLGTNAPYCLDDFFYHKGRKSLEPILQDTPYQNLRLVPGTSGLLDVANPRYQQKQALIRELRQLKADLIIIDLDAGARLNTLDFFLMTDTNGILVITAEKTSIDNAFKFLRAALYRRIERFYQAPELALLLKRHSSLPAFLEGLRRSDCFSREMRDTICGEIMAIAQSTKPRIVVNRARNAYEAQIAANIFAKQARNELLIETENLGFVFFDPVVSEAINSGIPFVLSHADQRISECIEDIANRLGYI